MSEQSSAPEEMKAFEAALAALAPRRDRLDRDRLMFLAGQASVLSAAPVCAGRGALGRLPWMWPAAFSTMTALAATLMVAPLGASRP